MQQLHWEDFIPGTVAEYGPRLITREEIVAFAAEFDPQPMHLDEAAAAQSMLGGLSASGWHSCCLLRRILTDGLFSRSRFLGAAGIEEVCWRAPVRPDTNLQIRATVLGARPSEDGADWGYVDFLFEMVDDAGTRLMTMKASPRFARRAQGAAAIAVEARR
jgi:acyl dehydratase